MNINELETTVRALVARGKGILAADESDGTIKKRFDAIQLESNAENRRAYRELLFTTVGIEEFLSGVILFDETIHQAAANDLPFPQLLAAKGIIPGIKVDRGTVPLAGHPGEKITEGLDGLRQRLETYRELGARFAKWRAVITIGGERPSSTGIVANAHALARYAALCQESGLVPIVEPEVLMDGSHDIEICAAVTEATLRTVFAELQAQGVHLEGMLLKPNMVLPGKTSPDQVSIHYVAAETVGIFRRVVPAAVPGIVFLSGGQSPEQATAHLNAMNQDSHHPWELSFSYGRALQEPVLQTWQGNPANVANAQRSFYHRARCNSAARFGDYSNEMEESPA